MSSWIQRHANTHQSQLAATAVLSGAAVAGAILGYQTYRRKEAVKGLKASIPDISERHHAEPLTEYGTASAMSKEDERSAALARRAQEGDYDDGKGDISAFLRFVIRSLTSSSAAQI